MKKLISFLLSAMLVVSMLSSFAFADDVDTLDTDSEVETIVDDTNETELEENVDNNINNPIIEPELEDINDPLVDSTIEDTNERNEFVDENKPIVDVEKVVINSNDSSRIFNTTSSTTFDVNITTWEKIDNLVNFDNNKNGTIIVHMPTLSSNTVQHTFNNGETITWDLHYGYEFMNNATVTSPASNIFRSSPDLSEENIYKRYCYARYVDAIPFSSSDFTIDIKETTKPYLNLVILAHINGENCPAPLLEAKFGNLYNLIKLPCRVKYKLNGGSINGNSSDKDEWLYKDDELGTTFNAPTKGDQIFEGWYTDATGGTKVTKLPTDSTATYYAHYTGHVHNYSTSWTKDATKHWHKCTSTTDVCTAPKKDEANHSYGASGTARYTCSVCSYVDSAKKAAADQADLASAKAEAIAAINAEKGNDTLSDVLKAAQNAIDSINSSGGINQVLAARDKGIVDIRNARKSSTTNTTNSSTSAKPVATKVTKSATTKVAKTEDKPKEVKTPKKVAKKMFKPAKVTKTNEEPEKSFFEENMVYIITIGAALLIAAILLIVLKKKNK